MARVMFPVEKELARWSSLLLTTHRVIKGDGEETLLVHMISGTHLAYNAQPFYIVLAVLSCAGGVLARDAVREVNTIAIGCILAAVFAAMYFRTRYTSVRVLGDGRDLSDQVDGAAKEDARRFLDATERVACSAFRGPEPATAEDPLATRYLPPPLPPVFSETTTPT